MSLGLTRSVFSGRKLISFSARLVAFVFWIVAITIVSPAQSPDVGAVRGQVVDQAGGAIAACEILISNESIGLQRRTQTDNGGYYSIEGLPLTGRYKLSVSKTGFTSKETGQMELRAGEVASVNVTLGPAGASSEVTVFGTTEGVRSDSPDMGTRLDLQKIDDTPIFGRNITRLPLLNSAVRPAQTTGDLFLNNTLFVVNGNGRRETSFTIDGSDANDSWGRQSIFTNLPLAAIQEFTVLTNAFSAEYGWSTAAVVNVVTQAGTNSYHGDFLGLWRPPGIQARSPFAVRRSSDRLEDFSAALSGPIVEDRTHFFVSGEYDNQHRDSTITSPLSPGHFTGSIHRGLFISRLDHQINDTNSLTARFNFDRDHDTNPQDGVGGNSLPTAARTFQRKTYAAAISETAAISSNKLNEARFQGQFGDPITKFDPADPSTQFVYPGLATSGESRFGDLTNHQYEAADTFSISKGAHLLKFGIDAIHSTSGGIGQEFGTGFVLGQFTLNPGVSVPVPELTIADVARYTQSFGNASYQVREWLWSVFAQDDFKVRRDLTLNMGIRYEQQTFTQDPNNVAPRIGLAYNILGDDRTVLRAGYGVYYIEIPADFAAAANINGPTGTFTFSATPGQLGFPTSLSSLPAFPQGAILPPRNINILPGQAALLGQFFDVAALRGYPSRLLNPYEQQASLGIEHRFGTTWQLSVTYIHQRTIRLDRPADLNAPAPFNRTAPGQVRSASAADLTRPILPVANGFRQISATINDGDAWYDGLQVNLNKRIGNSFSLLLSYTYSHSLDTAEPDVPSSNPNDQTQLGSSFEKAPATLDQRNRCALSGWWQLPKGMTLGGIATLASGIPFNITTGVDNNGDGINADRPVIDGVVIGRNAGRGTPIYDFSTFFEKSLRFSERFQLSLRAEGFNLLNHPNILGRNGVYGNAEMPLPTFGMALGGIANVDPGREFQFSARFRF